MKKAVLPYIKTHKHVLMFLYFPFYLAWFFIMEQVVTEQYWVSYLPMDDKIPFIPAFILAYVLWFPNMIVPAFYLYFKDTFSFKRYGWYVIAGFSISMIIYMVFPNGQNLRPILPEEKDFFTWWVSLIYAADTNTNVLPSMHVVGCFGVAMAAWDARKKLPWIKKWLIPIFVVESLIAVSTLFVKQHSILDLFGGLALGVLVRMLICLIPKIGRKKRRPVLDGAD